MKAQVFNINNREYPSYGHLGCKEKNIKPSKGVSFEGLNRVLAKNAFKSAGSIQKLSDFYSASDSIVGNIPSEFINNIPKSKRANAIIDFYRSMNQSVHRLRNSGLEKTESRILEQIFAKLGVSAEKLNLKYLDSKNWGTGYQIEGLSGGNYVLKLFHVKAFGEQANGNGFEQAIASFWKKNAGDKSQITPFYFGDLNAGYMVTKFVDETNSKLEKYVHPEIFGLRSSDVSAKNILTGHNKINGIQFEYGSMNVIEPLLVKNKQWQKEIKNFFDAPLEKKLELIDTSSEQTKKYLAKVVNAFENDEKVACFEKLAKSKNNSILANLTEHFDVLNNEDKMIYFKRFMSKSDSTIRKGFVDNLDKFPADKRLEILVDLASHPDKEMVAPLLSKMPMLPVSSVEQARVVMDAILKYSDEKNLSYISSFLIYCPRGIRAEIYKKIAVLGNEEVHKKLMFAIPHLEKYEMSDCLHFLFENANASNKELIDKFVKSMSINFQNEFYSLNK